MNAEMDAKITDGGLYYLKGQARTLSMLALLAFIRSRSQRVQDVSRWQTFGTSLACADIGLLKLIVGKLVCSGMPAAVAILAAHCCETCVGAWPHAGLVP